MGTDWSLNPNQIPVAATPSRVPAPIGARMKRVHYASDEFKERILEKFGKQMPSSPSDIAKRESGFTGAEVGDHGKVMAEKIVRKGLEEFGLSEAELPTLKKSDGRKALIARAVRERTTVPLVWIAERLSMGVAGRVSHSVRHLSARESADRILRQDSKRLARMLSKYFD